MLKNANSQNKLKIKHKSATGCFWLLLHFLIYQSSVMSLPPGPASSCKRALHKRARSQTLKDIGRLCCARQPPTTSPPQTWTCLAAGTVAMILVDARWAETCPQSTEYTLQHRPRIRALTLSTLALFEFDGEKKRTNYKSSEVPDSIFIRLNE